MPTKLRIKMGHIEFEYEGDAQFDNDAIKDLFTHLESMIGAAPAAAFNPLNEILNPDQEPNGTNGLGDGSNLGIETIASRLDVSSGPDLVLAAAAHLQLVAGKKSFTRQELKETMKNAKGYFTTSIGSNFSKTVQTLVSSKKINALNNNELSLAAKELSSMRQKLVD